MKVLLAALNSKYIHSGLAIRYIYHSIDSECDCRMKEYTVNENLEDILADIVRGGYDLVGFSCYIWNIEIILRLCENLKKVLPELIIFLGGPEVSYNREDILRKCDFIDYILAGEGEQLTRDFVLSLQGKIPIENLQGIGFRKYRDDRSQEIIVSGEPAVISDLSSLKSPYDQVSEEDIQNKIIYYETSRGCVYNCSYCLSSVTKGVRYFPLSQVKRDIRKLIALKAKQIKFVDRTFNADVKRTLELIRFFKAEDDGKINFHFEVTAHLLGEELIEELKSSRPGLFQLEIGVQSTNPFTLAAINRKDNFQKLAHNVRLIQEKGNIHQHLDLIAGLPLENMSSFRKSFHDVYALFPDMLQLGFLKMLSGTPIRNQTGEHLYIFRSYPPYEVLSNKYLSAEELFYLKEIEQMLDSFYNSSLYHHSIRYLSKQYQKDYICLFEDILKYYKKSYGEGALSRDNGFRLLQEMAKCFSESENWNQEFFGDLLRFDFLRMGRNRVLPEFLKPKQKMPSREKLLEFVDTENIRNQLGMQEMHPLEIIKKTGVSVFGHDIKNYIETGEITVKDCMMIFDYSGKKDIHGKVAFAG